MKSDLWVGLIALVFAGIYYYLASAIPRSLLSDAVGADGLPKVYALALGLLAILLMVRSRTAPAGPDADADVKDLGQHLRALGLLALGVGYLLLINVAGYLFTIFLLIAAVALYCGAKLDLKLLSVSAGGGAGFWLIFVKMFNIPLPPGTLWQWLTG